MIAVGHSTKSLPTLYSTTDYALRGRALSRRIRGIFAGSCCRVHCAVGCAVTLR